MTWGKYACRQRADGSLLLADNEDGCHDLMIDSVRYGFNYLNLVWKNRNLLRFALGKPTLQSIRGEFDNFVQHRTLEPKPDTKGLHRAARAYAKEYPSAKPLQF